MKKLKLICICTAVAATLFSTTVFADTVQPEARALDLDAAVNMAIQNSYTIKKIDTGIQKAENSYQDATRSAVDYDNKLKVVKGDKRFDLIKARDFPQIEYKYAIFQYKNVKEVAKNQISLGVYQLYSGLLSLKEGMDVQQKNLNNVEQQYKKAKLQASVGMASPVEIKKSEAAYTAEKTKLNSLQRQYDGLNKQLNQLLGVNINTKYSSFSKDNLAESAPTKAYNDYVNEALINRVEIKNDTENINAKKLEFESIRGYYPKNDTPQYKVAQYPLEEAKNKLDTDKIDIAIEINTLYNDLQNKVKKLAPEQKKYDSAKKTYDKALQTYNVGMLSKIDFERAEVGLKYEEAQLKAIKRDIWIAQTKLDYAANLGADASNLVAQGSEN